MKILELGQPSPFSQNVIPALHLLSPKALLFSNRLRYLSILAHLQIPQQPRASQLRRGQTVLQKEIRTVHSLDDPFNRSFCDNKIMTSKYTVLTFLPKNLFEQFSKLANVYFLFISFMQMVPMISISKGKPVMLLPLTFVILVSAVKDIFEDWKRHKSDSEENNKIVEVYHKQTNELLPIRWKDLRVGQVVKVYNEQFLPADMVLLKSSNSKGLCYVETKNLDGETNLKHKVCDKHLNSEEHIGNYDGVLKCEEANDKIYLFEGSFSLPRRGT